jgi:WD40 repeat protein
MKPVERPRRIWQMWLTLACLLQVGFSQLAAQQPKLEKTLVGHWGHIFSVAFSPDAKTIASASRDNTIKMWDVASGKNITTINGHTHFVYSLAFSPDGKRLASGSGDQTIRFWDPATGKEKALLRHAGGVDHVTFTPDGKTLASVSQQFRTPGEIKLWDLARAKDFATLKGHASYVYSLAFSPNGKTLASGSADNTIKFWDVVSGTNTITLQADGEEVMAVAFSPDGRTLASGSLEGTISLWEVASGKKRAVLGRHQPAFAAPQDGPPPDWVLCLAFSPDGNALVSGRHDGTITMWTLASTITRAIVKEHTDAVWSVAFSPDGKTLASGSCDRTIKLWHVPTLTKLDASHLPGRVIEAKQLNSLWSNLGSTDATEAYQAILALTRTPTQAVGVVRERLRPDQEVDHHQVAHLLADLDSDRFAVRERATQELKRLGDLVEPALRHALTGKPSAEVRRRIGAVLQEIDLPNSPGRLRALRAVELLEQIGTPAARQTLRELAQGAPAGRLAREAKTALERLARQSKATP